MTKIELLQETAKSLLDSGVLTTDELNSLWDNAKSQEEIDFYGQIYNYLIGKRQKEVIKNEQY